MPNLGEVYKLYEFYKTSRINHELINEKDYIRNPKKDGYRGIHLVFRYRGQNDTARKYDGLLLEVQLRTALQHSWATAVEMAGLINGTKYKNGLGSRRWLKFFEITSKMVELLEYVDTDGAKYVPEPSRGALDLYGELKTVDPRWKITTSLQNFAKAVQVINDQENNSEYYIVQMNPIERATRIYGFSKMEIGEAIRLYDQMEHENAGTEIDQVLVTAGKLKDLKRAYPNYFPDVSMFVAMIGALAEVYDGADAVANI